MKGSPRRGRGGSEEGPGPVTPGWGRMGFKDRADLSRFTSRVELVASRDLRDAISELRLVLAMVTLTLAIPIGSGSGVRALAAFGGGTAVVNRLSLVGAFFVVFIPASFSLVLALESFVGERERTTLEVLLSTPLREAEIYLGKVVAVLTVSLALCYGGLIVYCLVTFTGLGYFPLGILLALALSTICQVAAMVAGAVIISLNARTMRAANVMASRRRRAGAHGLQRVLTRGSAGARRRPAPPASAGHGRDPRELRGATWVAPPRLGASRANRPGGGGISDRSRRRVSRGLHQRHPSRGRSTGALKPCSLRRGRRGV